MKTQLLPIIAKLQRLADADAQTIASLNELENVAVELSDAVEDNFALLKWLEAA